MSIKNSIPAMLIKAGQLLFFFLLIYPQCALALLPKEIIIIANSNVKKSIELSKEYMSVRNIPKENLLTLEVENKETIERDVYNQKLVRPIRKFLARHQQGHRIRCILLIYGMPLKIEAPPLTPGEKHRVALLEKKITELRLQLSKIHYKSGEKEEKLKNELEMAVLERKQLEPLNYRAALDSELMAVLVKDYPLTGGLRNPFFLGFRDQNGLVDKNEVLMVSRLDGPSPKDVSRMLSDAIFAEKNGLKGKAYFDARWKSTETSEQKGYSFYDQSIHKSAALIRENTEIIVNLDEKETLFQPGECPETALYCGWYSLGTYIPAFTWARGAIGYHIASSECATLKKKGSQVWCKRMIEEGVAATLGPVEEPFVQAFPVPSIFFSYLVEGNLSLAECYLLSLPYLSWKMVLIGDPLYRPFGGMTHFTSQEKTG